MPSCFKWVLEPHSDPHACKRSTSLSHLPPPHLILRSTVSCPRPEWSSSHPLHCAQTPQQLLGRSVKLKAEDEVQEGSRESWGFLISWPLCCHQAFVLGRGWPAPLMERAAWKEDMESSCAPQLSLHLCLFPWPAGEDKVTNPLPFILTGLWPAVAWARCRREGEGKVEKLVQRFQMKS